MLGGLQRLIPLRCPRPDPFVSSQLDKGKRFKFGRGIYTAPDPAVAARYAKRLRSDSPSSLRTPIPLKAGVGRG